MSIIYFKLFFTLALCTSSFLSNTMDWEYHFAQCDTDQQNIAYLEQVFAERASNACDNNEEQNKENEYKN